MSEQVILAKKIYTLDKPNEFFTAMVIKDGKIIELTQKERINLEKDSSIQIVDFSSDIIIPGFNDSHIHAVGFGIYRKNITLVGCGKKEFLRKIQDKVDSLNNDDWIIGRGWDHENFEDSILPSKEDLDSVSNNHPILLHRICGHICVVNSKALQLAGITKDTPDPEGGLLDRDPTTGDLTGILRERAIDLVKACIPSIDSRKKIDLMKEALKELNSQGITSIQSVDENAYSLYKSLKDNEELTVRVYLTPMIDELPELIKSNVKSCEGDDLLRWGRIKLFSDGSLGAETAALNDNYENSSSNGLLIYTDQKLHDLLVNAHTHGWQIEVHAIGDLSAEQVVRQFEITDAYTNRAVLTHCQILNESIIEKMAKLGIVANIQPIFLNTDLHWAEKKIGVHRMKYSYAWKTLRNASILCAGGSDAPVERPDPLLGIHAAVNRQDNTDYPPEGWYKNESLSVWEAVKLFTVNSAYAEFQEHQKGKLLVNYLADFIVLDKDIFEIPTEDLKNIQVKATFLGGKQVFKQNY